jgi:hypothetical protein
MVHSPVFIVGSPRSGTSVLVRGLFAAGYSGFNEGHVLSLVRIIERDVDRHFESFFTPAPRVLISQIDRAALKHRLAELIAQEAARHQADGPWLDKTGGPDMIEAIPTLQQLFPGSRFVFAKRRAIENIVSRIVKFPKHGFDFHCAGWARTMAAWRQIRQTLPDLAGIEIDQHDISAEPARTAATLAEFLALPPPATEQMASVFAHQRPQQTQAGSADRVLSLQDLPWTDAQKATFQTLCGAEMTAFGYVTDQRYRA